MRPHSRIGPGKPASVVRLPPRTTGTRKQDRRSGPGDGVTASAAPKSPSSEDTDDFRHRMWTNLAGFAVAATLAAVGVWLAISIADMRKAQDCALAGHRNCAPITTPRS